MGRSVLLTGSPTAPTTSGSCRGTNASWENTFPKTTSDAQLLHDVELDVGDTLSDHSERLRRGIGNVDDASGNVGSAVVDPYRHRLAGRDIGHAQPRAEREGRMRSGQFMGIEFFAARGFCAFRIETAKTLRGRLRILVRRERGMFPCGDARRRRE